MTFQKQHCSDQRTGTRILQTVLPDLPTSESTVCPTVNGYNIPCSFVSKSGSKFNSMQKIPRFNRNPCILYIEDIL